MIAISAPHLRLKRFATAIDHAIQRVINSTQFVLGREVEAFEHNFAEYLGVRHCVAVNSGTDALALALRGLGVGPGDEVITVSMTFAGTAIAVLQTGAEPCFVDIDPITRCMDIDQIEGAITPRTSAILPVHLHGYPMDMAHLMALADHYHLAVVEDCAQAHGARTAGRIVGSWGHFGAFSFYPTKNLGCIGDGGAIVTQDASLAARVRALRHYGWPEGQRISMEMGYNSRLDEIQAAVLNTLLPHLDEGNRERVENAVLYRNFLDSKHIDLPPDHPGAVYHQFVIGVDKRDIFQAYLKEKWDIATGIHYAVPLHHQPVFSRFASRPLPVTDELARRILSLPIQPEVVAKQLASIAEIINRGLVECMVS